MQERMKTEYVPHPKWLCTYMFAHRVVSWTLEQSGCLFSATIAGFPVFGSAIGSGFLHIYVGFRQIKHTSHMLQFCMPTFGNGRINSKTACICLYRVRFPKLGHSAFQHRKHKALTSPTTCRDSTSSGIAQQRSWRYFTGPLMSWNGVLAKA